VREFEPNLPDAASLDDYQVFQARRLWNPSSTWTNAALSPWEMPGALGSADRGAVVGTLDGDGLTGEHKISLNAAGVAMVQSWLDNPSAFNRGVIISNDDIVRLLTMEASSTSSRPVLEVVYGITGRS